MKPILIALHSMQATPQRCLAPAARDYGSAAFWLATLAVVVVAINVFFG